MQDDYPNYDATDLATLIATRQTSAREVLDAAIARANALNPSINAIVLTDYDAARERASAAPPAGPLGGVPYLVKDLAAAAGLRMSFGSRHYRYFVPDADAPFIARAKAAGANVFGKTSTSEFGQMPVTEPELFGPCRNPWNLDHTPGGSSGGAAAAVAAGIVPLAHASDGGGSIRIPASCCGLFGFKPGYDPQLAVQPVPGDLIVNHAISRSVRDSALLFDLTTGRAGTPEAALARLDEPVGPLRIGLVTDPLFAASLSPDVLAALDDAARLAESLGHVVEPVTLPIDRARAAETFLTCWATIVEPLVHDAQALTGRRPRGDEFEPASRAMAQVGRHVARERLPVALDWQKQLIADMASATARYDLVLCATLAAPPVRIGELRSTPLERAQMRLLAALPARPLLRMMLAKAADRAFAWAGCTELFNLTGQPAMSVPLHWNARGLPVGVQFAARLGDDARLLRFARQLELARPWFARRPPLVPAAR
ncbi:amidase [Burkholderia plantarii]|uniref:Amidase AmiE n=1 Tax=Burkholderia plantarii TaxID=41899 RepID=A0A0B6RXJ1_BURPL|nr:amidase [Burkholderia plantarii]AJK44731.1 amidase AmiE [Burkholderia plantarii]ALK29010.1 Asp-tRNAAsn/Glu-tRNAGln amidotransferase A subunit [Burkholderia plantarii]WLE61003.1 amidase [Burkholderia plantarii]GLZ17546.1 amidase [Burkholderia plantarii]